MSLLATKCVSQQNLRIIICTFHGDRGVMTLNGKIDRMDLCEEDEKVFLKIIDYKSGSTKFDLTSVFSWPSASADGL